MLEIWYDPNGTWAALYVDGKLDKVGDSSGVEERVMELAEVVVEHDNAFLRGGDGRASVASTVDAITEYREARDEQRQKVAELREQARDLANRANEIERTLL